MCKGSQTTTSQSAPNPQAMAAYSDLLSRASGVASTPFVPYSGEFVAPLNAQQNTAGANINANAGFAQPYIQQAAGYATQAAQPITASQIAGFQSPYTQQVVNATQAQFNNANKQQLENLRGNAAAQGALGGDREAVAEANLSNQQNLAQAPVIAGLYNSGYNTALSTALAEQQNLGQSAYSLGNLGVAGQNAALTGANAQLGFGTLGQSTQQAQDTALYNQFLAQQGFPFQEAQWLAGLDTAVGSQMGGTSSTTGPAPNPLNSILGLGLLGASFFPKKGGGGVGYYRHGGKIKGFALGGMPYAGGSTYIPSMGLTMGAGAPRPPGSSGQPGPDPLKQASSFLDIEKKIQGLGGGSGTYGGFRYNGLDDLSGSDFASAAQAGVESGLSFDPMTGDVFRRGGRIRGFAYGGYADGGSPDMPITLPTFGERMAGFGAIPSENVDDRRGEGPDGYLAMQGFNNLVGAAYRHFVPGLRDLDLPHLEGRPRRHPSGHLHEDAGYYDIGRHRDGGRIRGFAGGGLADDLGIDDIGPGQSFDDRFNSATDYGSRDALPIASSPPVAPSLSGGMSLGDIGPGTGFDFNPVRTNGNRAYGPEASDYDLPPIATTPASPLPAPVDVADTRVAGLGSPSIGDTGGGYSGAPMSFAGAPELGSRVSQEDSGKQKGFGLGLLNLSPDMRRAMMTAGFAMMASRSPFVGNAIGEGGLAGMSSYAGSQKEALAEQKTQASIEDARKKLEQHADEFSKKLALDTKRLQDQEEHQKFLRDQAEKGRVPQGYERVENGLRAIPGGPADPEAAAKLAGAKRNATGVQLPDEAWASNGDEFLKYLPASDREFIKKVANYEIDPKTLSVVGGHRENTLKMAAQYDPNFDQKTYNQRYQAVQRFTTGKQGDTVRSLNVAVEHLGTLGELTDALGNGDVQAVNRINNFLRTQFGTPAVTNFNAGKQIIADEVLKAVLGTGAGSQSDREELQRQFSAANSPAQLKGAIETAEKLMAGQVKGLRQQYEFATGSHNFDNMLTPATRQRLHATEAAPGGGGGGGGRSAVDQQALEWANANPNDPRAVEIKRRLGVQ